MTDDPDSIEVTRQEVEKCAEEVGALSIFETSAKRGTGINSLFEFICKHYSNSNMSPLPQDGVDVGAQDDVKSKSCCSK